MKQELREQLGKVAFKARQQALIEHHMLRAATLGTWEELREDEKEIYYCEAEAAVSTFVASIMPAAQNFVQSIRPVCTPEQRAQIDSAIETIKKVVEE